MPVRYRPEGSGAEVKTRHQALSFTKSNMADKIVRVCIRLGIGGLFVINASGELFPHQACKQVNALKDENGILVEVPETCREQFKEVALKLGLKNSAQKVTLFVNEGFHAVSAGSTWFPAGAVIGLPRWYLYQTKEDVETSGLKFQGRNIQWDSELGETVKFCYVPTNDMIAFTIGHELAHIQRLDFKMFDIFASPFWLFLTYKMIRFVHYRTFKKQAMWNLLLNLSVCGVNYFAYRLVNRKVQHFSEFNADKISAECTPQIAKGGVDFFTRRLKLNLVQRSLLGEEGEDVFTEEGNEVKSYTHPRLTDRLDKVKFILSNSDFQLDSR